MYHSNSVWFPQNPARLTSHSDGMKIQSVLFGKPPNSWNITVFNGFSHGFQHSMNRFQSRLEQWRAEYFGMRPVGLYVGWDGHNEHTEPCISFQILLLSSSRF